MIKQMTLLNYIRRMTARQQRILLRVLENLEELNETNEVNQISLAKFLQMIHDIETRAPNPQYNMRFIAPRQQNPNGTTTLNSSWLRDGYYDANTQTMYFRTIQGSAFTVSNTTERQWALISSANGAGKMLWDTVWYSKRTKSVGRAPHTGRVRINGVWHNT